MFVISDIKGVCVVTKRFRANTTRIEIMQVGTRMFLEKGFTETSVQAISEELEISKGNFTFHFPTKEHLLLELTKYLVKFHTREINIAKSEGLNNLLAYCWEVTAQIAMCEEHPQAKDFYRAIYAHPSTLSYIKNWTAAKNEALLSDKVPDWTTERFQLVENVASHIEMSALTEPCSEAYPLEDKITLTVDSLLKLYEIPKNERQEAIARILTIDYRGIGKKMFSEFIDYVERLNQQALDDALEGYSLN